MTVPESLAQHGRQAQPNSNFEYSTVARGKTPAAGASCESREHAGKAYEHPIVFAVFAPTFTACRNETNLDERHRVAIFFIEIEGFIKYFLLHKYYGQEIPAQPVLAKVHKGSHEPAG